MNRLVVPYVGNSTAAIDAIIESRVEKNSYQFTPLELLQRASFNMIMRLAGKMGQVTQDEHPTPADIRNVAARCDDYSRDR